MFLQFKYFSFLIKVFNNFIIIILKMISNKKCIFVFVFLLQCIVCSAVEHEVKSEGKKEPKGFLAQL